MTSEPIRFLDDPSAAAELREFMLGQARPDGLPAQERAVIERRIAASALALPVSLKLAGLFSPGGATTGGSLGSAGVGTTGVGTVGAGSAAGAASSAAVTSSAVAATAPAGVAAGGVVAGASVAPTAAAGAGLTLVGAKGVAAGLAGAVSVTKGAAVLGVALATGAGAGFVAHEVGPTRAPAAETEAATLPGTLPGSRAARGGGPALEVPRSVDAKVPGAAFGEPEPAGPLSGEGELAKLPAARTGLSLEDLEDVEHRAEAAASPGAASPQPAAIGDAESERSTAAASSSDRLDEEVELLRRAQQLLRVDRTLAAEALERYDAKFPDGAMRAEYDVLRRRLVGSSHQ